MRIRLKKGDLEKAVDIFQYGLMHSNNFEQKNYFFTALCVARMRLNQYREAKKLLTENEKFVEVSQFNQLILVHSSAETGDVETAEHIACNVETEEPHLKDVKKRPGLPLWVKM